MSDDSMRITAANGIPFTVRIVREGDSYGLNWCKTHDEARPLVEFYDARFDNAKFTPGYGQFVSRYYASTLLGTDEWANGPRERGRGLCLDGGVPAWEVDGASMDAVMEWVKERLDAAPAPKM